MCSKTDSNIYKSDTKVGVGYNLEFMPYPKDKISDVLDIITSVKNIALDKF